MKNLNLKHKIAIRYPFSCNIYDNFLESKLLKNILLNKPTLELETYDGGRKGAPLSYSFPHPSYEHLFTVLKDYNFFLKIFKELEGTKYFPSLVLDENKYNFTMDYNSCSDGYALGPHVDFQPKVVVMLLYLNDKNWENGDLLLHKKDLSSYPVSIASLQNRAVFFLSTDDSFHSVLEQFNSLEPRLSIYGAWFIDN